MGSGVGSPPEPPGRPVYLTVVSGQWSVVSGQWSVVSGQLFNRFWWFTIVSCQFPSVVSFSDGLRGFGADCDGQFGVIGCQRPCCPLMTDV